MAKLVEYRPRNLPEYLDQIERLQAATSNALWFRGAALTTQKLIPTLYRHPSIKKSQELQALEVQLMTRFRQRGMPYHSRDLKDDWDALFFMQHYGVPTRLLDWTENPFTALYFALMTPPRVGGRPAAVWVLDPFRWNQTALRRLSYGGGPFVAGDADLRPYGPDSAASAANTHPVALYGAHNSPRIVAQQGVFTIFGTNRVPMEALVRNDTFGTEALCRIVITPARTEPMRGSLLNFGITESTVFPDLEGLAKETKRHFGFEA